jgi:hypothetical protein
LALQTITKAFAQAGCKSLNDTNAVEVMRGLGGYTKVINDCIQRVLRRFAGNPRASPVLEIALRTLNSRIPEIRTKAQTFLGRIKLHGGETGPFLNVGFWLAKCIAFRATGNGCRAYSPGMEMAIANTVTELAPCGSCEESPNFC